MKPPEIKEIAFYGPIAGTNYCRIVFEGRPECIGKIKEHCIPVSSGWGVARVFIHAEDELEAMSKFLALFK